MAVPPNNSGPARGPVRIPPLSTIIKEGEREIIRQVRQAVERAVTAGIAVDPARLRKWGPDGGRYFAKTLRARIMPPPQEVALGPGGVPPGNGAGLSEASTATIDPGEASREIPADPRRSHPVIRTEAKWMEKERDRWSVAMRAFAQGMTLACLLLLLAMIVLKTWS